MDSVGIGTALGKNLGIFSDTVIVQTELGVSVEAEMETIIRESGRESRPIIPKICVENLVVTNALFDGGTLVLDGARSQIFIKRTNDEDFVTCLHILKNFF